MMLPMSGSRNHRPQMRADRELTAVALVHVLDLVRDREHQHDREEEVDDDAEHAAEAVAVVLLQVLVGAVGPEDRPRSRG